MPLFILCALTMGLLVLASLLLARKLRRLRQLRRRQQHIWETHNIFQLFDRAAPLPPPGGWAASTDLLGELVRVVAARQPRVVVELGSGLSTLVIAAALRRNRAGRLICVEADDQYAHSTRAQLHQHALDDWATGRSVPLQSIEFEGERRPWYDTSLLGDVDSIDLLFIDGPPTALRRDIRYPALPFFWNKLNAGAVVLLDDADRPAESAMAKSWQRRFPQALFEHLRFEKGALRVTSLARVPAPRAPSHSAASTA